MAAVWSIEGSSQRMWLRRIAVTRCHCTRLCTLAGQLLVVNRWRSATCLRSRRARRHAHRRSIEAGDTRLPRVVFLGALQLALHHDKLSCLECTHGCCTFALHLDRHHSGQDLVVDDTLIPGEHEASAWATVLAVAHGDAGARRHQRSWRSQGVATVHPGEGGGSGRSRVDAHRGVVVPRAAVTPGTDGLKPGIG
jgi:hypothetical protein